MTELEKLKAAHEKLQREYDALLRTHILHMLTARAVEKINNDERALH